VDFAHAIVSIAIILICCILLIKLVNRLLGALSKKEIISPPFLIILQSVLKWLVYAVIILLILQQIGISMNSLWAVISAIVAMIAIGFAAVWSVLCNLLCAIMLLIFQPFRIGDEIEIIDPAMTSGVGGRVRNITLIFTTLEVAGTDPRYQTAIQVPNNLFFQKIIRSKSGHKTFSLDQQIFERHSLLGREGETDQSTGSGGVKDRRP
jgi:small-conductance mechanosensitive channel